MQKSTKVLIISTTRRKNGNSAVLAKEFEGERRMQDTKWSLYLWWIKASISVLDASLAQKQKNALWMTMLLGLSKKCGMQMSLYLQRLFIPIRCAAQ